MLSRRVFLGRSRKHQFSRIFREGGFGCSPSLSGSGSTLEQTQVIRNEIPKLLREFQVQSILDAPCGDLYWMRHVDLGGIHYIGADIVAELIRRNIAAFGTSDKRHFIVCDLGRDNLPKVDLVLCRDCLVHLKLADALEVIRNIKRSGARFLLVTTHVHCGLNRELGPNFFRPLNLQLPPFELSPPLRLISEQCTEQDAADKCLGLWDIQTEKLGRESLTDSVVRRWWSALVTSVGAGSRRSNS
jgi:SAM-dependent methyltransferase